ncbi:MAG: class I SAM-dependent methyltransferase [Candidatus Daviesbacteria bacterium]|nr:class I SAM-dependent methyltransferase [Candidatus Daviesbacteria bacterium]
MRCPICNQNKWLKYLSDLVRCLNCGFIRAQDKYFKINPTEFYGQNYFTSGYGDYTKEQAALEKNFQDRIQRIRKYQDGGKLLEIGCAHGYFLKSAQKYYQCFGIDLNPEVTAVTKKNTNAKIFTGDFLTQKFPKNYFDIVCMFDTIEHLKYPEKYLKKVNEILKPNGFIVIETGDIDSLVAKLQGKGWRLIMLPDHLQYFSKSSLIKLLTNSGFKIRQVNLVGFFRTIRQIIYRLTGSKKILHLSNTILDKSIPINTFDLVFIIGQRDN